MSIMHYFRTAFGRLEQLDLHQLTLVTMAILTIGFFCLRGFGSRSNY